MGLFVAADRQNRLDRLLSGGLVVHERVESLSHWQSLNYQIEANSPARDFVAGIRPDGCFASCLAASPVRHWLEDGRSPPPLEDVSAFLRSMAARVADLQQQHPALKLQWGSSIQSVHWDGQTFLTRSGACPPVRSNQLLLACGARPSMVDVSHADASSDAPRVNADAVLRGQAAGDIERALRKGAPIAILGAAHSAFSVVCFLLQRYGDRIPEQGLRVVLGHRPVTLWWPSPAAATSLCASDRVDPHTGEVNKFNGLRGAARRMYLSIRNGIEKRAVLVQEAGAPAAPEGVWTPVALTICAAGYTANAPSITVANGHGIRLDVYRGIVCKDGPTGQLMSEGKPIAGMFGLGIGFADRQGDTFEVGVNFFHGPSADKVLHRILG